LLISGVVQDRTGRPVECARVYLTDGPKPFPDIAALTADDGSFGLFVATDGTYTLGCTAEGLGSTSVVVTIRSNEDSMVDIQF
jgi:Carboxypeptidase regulatory-like domain